MPITDARRCVLLDIDGRLPEQPRARLLLALNGEIPARSARMSESSWVSLVAHPDTPNPAVRRMAACAQRVGRDSLRFEYVLEADPQQVRVAPPAAAAGRADGLWAHTCFEAFIGVPQSPGYLELNFSPSGEWAAYRFESYRQGMEPAALVAPPRLTLDRRGARLELQAEVRLSGPEAAGRRLRLALSTVVEDREGRLSYWAPRHAPGRPDFHHPDSFSLAIELPATP
jgi:hypothetical protein